MAQLQEAITQTESCDAGETIFERGAPGDTCYIIVSGEVEVLVPDALGNEIVVSTLGTGDFFGEIALLQSVPRTAAVRATQSSHFLVLNRRSLGTVSRIAPSVVEMLMEISRRRLRARMQDPQELVSPLRESLRVRFERSRRCAGSSRAYICTVWAKTPNLESA